MEEPAVVVISAVVAAAMFFSAAADGVTSVIPIEPIDDDDLPSDRNGNDWIDAGVWSEDSVSPDEIAGSCVDSHSCVGARWVAGGSCVDKGWNFDVWFDRGKDGGCVNEVSGDEGENSIDKVCVVVGRDSENVEEAGKCVGNRSRIDDLVIFISDDVCPIILASPAGIHPFADSVEFEWESDVEAMVVATKEAGPLSSFR